MIICPHISFIPLYHILYTVYLIPYNVYRLPDVGYVVSIRNTSTPTLTLVPVQSYSVQRILKRLEESNMLYIVPSGANDDWYWIYATVNTNRKNAAYVVRMYVLSSASIFFLHLFHIICHYIPNSLLFHFFFSSSPSLHFLINVSFSVLFSTSNICLICACSLMAVFAHCSGSTSLFYIYHRQTI